MPAPPNRETGRHVAIVSSGPVSTEGTATFHPQHWYELTQSCRVTYTYTNGVTVIVGEGQKDIPGGATLRRLGGEGLRRSGQAPEHARGQRQQAALGQRRPPR